MCVEVGPSHGQLAIRQTDLEGNFPRLSRPSWQQESAAIQAVTETVAVFLKGFFSPPDPPTNIQENNLFAYRKAWRCGGPPFPPRFMLGDLRFGSLPGSREGLFLHLTVLGTGDIIFSLWSLCPGEKSRLDAGYGGA